jgi:hypothetical protein
MKSEAREYISASTKSQDHKGKARFKGRFINESLGDKHPVKPGQVFTKQWTFRNDGEVAWPQDVWFIKTTGDDMGTVDQHITRVLQPGEDYVWEMQLTAPKRPGRYTAYFRLQTGHSVRFGHKVWCDILVEPVIQQPDAKPAINPVEEKLAPQISSKSIMDAVLSGVSIEVTNDEIDHSIGQTLYSDKQVEPDVLSIEKPQVLPKTFKQIYNEKVQEISQLSLKTALITLFEAGF